MCKVPDDVNTYGKACVVLFCKGCSQEALPPTSDAYSESTTLDKHITIYQATVWKQAIYSYSCDPQVTDSGWNAMDGRLVPKLMTLPHIQTWAETCQEVHAVAPQPVKLKSGVRL